MQLMPPTTSSPDRAHKRRLLLRLRRRWRCVERRSREHRLLNHPRHCHHKAQEETQDDQYEWITEDPTSGRAWFESEDPRAALAIAVANTGF